jgi:hypothetical protein
MVEGSPNPHHSMKGLVIPAALELADDMLLWFLINDYGFELVSPKNGRPFCRREV